MTQETKAGLASVERQRPELDKTVAELVREWGHRAVAQALDQAAPPDSHREAVLPRWRPVPSRFDLPVRRDQERRVQYCGWPETLAQDAAARYEKAIGLLAQLAWELSQVPEVQPSEWLGGDRETGWSREMEPVLPIGVRAHYALGRALELIVKGPEHYGYHLQIRQLLSEQERVSFREALEEKGHGQDQDQDRE